MMQKKTFFKELHKLGYLPIKKKGFAWLTLYLETIISSLSWKSSTSVTIALQYRRNVTEWVMKKNRS